MSSLVNELEKPTLWTEGEGRWMDAGTTEVAAIDSRGSRVGMFLKICCPVLEIQSGRRRRRRPARSENGVRPRSQRKRGQTTVTKTGRVENRFPPALPHQTVHAVFPHTAFRCSSCRGMRRAPARPCGNLVQPIALVEVAAREPAQAGSSVLDLVAIHQVGSQPVFRMGSDLAHRQA